MTAEHGQLDGSDVVRLTAVNHWQRMRDQLAQAVYDPESVVSRRSGEESREDLVLRAVLSVVYSPYVDGITYCGMHIVPTPGGQAA